MTHRLPGLAALLIFAALATAQAPNACCPAGPSWRSPGCANVLKQTYHCPNDYCAKPMPFTCSITKFGKDDYCSKDMPRTCTICQFGKDDYRGKAPPCVRAFCAPWYICGPEPRGPASADKK
jgi:hypothetical protein